MRTNGYKWTTSARRRSESMNNSNNKNPPTVETIPQTETARASNVGIAERTQSPRWRYYNSEGVGPLTRFLRAENPEHAFPNPRIILFFLFGVALSAVVLQLTSDEYVVGPHGKLPPSESLIPNSEFPVHIAFKDVGCVLPNVERAVLRNVTGEIRPHKLTGILGQSGSGKTTFAYALLGRGQRHCRPFAGEVFLNGRPRSLEAFLDRVGYVPQDDVLYPDLTVEETLWFSADWRLPRSVTLAQKQALLEDTLRMLDLLHIRKQRIGDVQSRGISGGEKKRVSIGMELIAQPSVLVMDEPTSGLDSAAAFRLVQTLRTIAEQGVSVVAVIHQPSTRVFELFHDVILMQLGQAAYIGPREGAMPFLAHVGYQVPNAGTCSHPPAEYLLDVLADLERPSASKAKATQQHQEQSSSSSSSSSSTDEQESKKGVEEEEICTEEQCSLSAEIVDSDDSKMKSDSYGRKVNSSCNNSGSNCKNSAQPFHLPSAFREYSAELKQWSGIEQRMQHYKEIEDRIFTALFDTHTGNDGDSRSNVSSVVCTSDHQQPANADGDVVKNLNDAADDTSFPPVIPPALTATMEAVAAAAETIVKELEGSGNSDSGSTDESERGSSSNTASLSLSYGERVYGVVLSVARVLHQSWCPQGRESDGVFCKLITSSQESEHPYFQLPKPGLKTQFSLWFMQMINLTFRKGIIAEVLVIAMLATVVALERSYNSPWNRRGIANFLLSISIGLLGMVGAVFNDHIGPVQRATGSGMLMGAHEFALLAHVILKGWVSSHLFALVYFSVLWSRNGVWCCVSNNRVDYARFHTYYEFCHMVHLNYLVSSATGSVICVLCRHDLSMSYIIAVAVLLSVHVFAYFTPNSNQVERDSKVLVGFGNDEFEGIDISPIIKMLCQMSYARYFMEAIMLWEPDKYHDKNGRRYALKYFGYKERNKTWCCILLFALFTIIQASRFIIFASFNNNGFHSLYDTPALLVFICKVMICHVLALIIMTGLQEVYFPWIAGVQRRWGWHEIPVAPEIREPTVDVMD